jgi:hypothetical protein
MPAKFSGSRSSISAALPGYLATGPQMAALLGSPAFERDRRTGKARPIAEGRDAAAILIDEVFQIIQRAAARLEPLQQLAPRGLALVGMAEHDVAVGQGGAVLGQFLEPEDDGVGGASGHRFSATISHPAARSRRSGWRGPRTVLHRHAHALP